MPKPTAPSGPQYWRSLEHLANSREVRESIENEFVGYDPQALLSMGRRRFMKLIGASMALAGIGLNGCRRWPKEELVPYASNYRDRVPGVPEIYASSFELGGVSTGVLVTSFDGRPIKVEGNPSHPFAATADGKLGASDAWMQASVLELYDPERSRSPVENVAGEGVRARTLTQFKEAAGAALTASKSAGGSGLAVLSDSITGPTASKLKAEFLAAYPGAKWYEYEPLNRDNEIAGAPTNPAGGKLRSRLHLDKADVVVLFDADVLGTGPAKLRYANDWANRRRGVDASSPMMNRVYLAESGFSITGASADERLPTKPSRIEALVEAVARGLQIAVSGESAALNEAESKWVAKATADLQSARGKAVAAAGGHLSPFAHSLVAAINAKIDAFQKGVVSLYPEPMSGDQVGQIGSLVNDIKTGKVQTLLVLGGNPVYDAPAELELKRLIGNVPLTIHHSLYFNETSLACKWHVNKAHYLESWGDGVAFDGTVSLQQPLIEPLFDGLSTIQLLAWLARGEEKPDGMKLVRATFGGDEAGWKQGLHDGIAAAKPAPVTSARPTTINPQRSTPKSGFEVRFLPDYSMYDGRFANSGWLQEMPDPLTKMVWDNAALISKKDADALRVDTGGVLKITVNGRSIEIPAYILPGQPVGVIGLPLGYGRSGSEGTGAGSIGADIGVDVYALRTGDSMHYATGAQVTATGASHQLVSTQDHHITDSVAQSGKDVRIGDKGKSGEIIHDATLAEFTQPKFKFPGEHLHPLQLFKEPNPMPAKREGGPTQFNSPHAWGMSIDTGTCIGCMACVVGCQAENNIPSVGKPEVAANREMHWIRIDRYFKGSPDDENVQVVYQPMMCQHCENAPCEQVCPVAATVHDTEGLNTMVYNRCIGTRYCSNNCPYKVRRFNYFDWHSNGPRANRFPLPWAGIPDAQQKASVDQIHAMVFNPEVTVRMRGVMEKCTYCMQRIHNTKIVLRREVA